MFIYRVFTLNEVQCHFQAADYKWYNYYSFFVIYVDFEYVVPGHFGIYLNVKNFPCRYVA